MGTAFKENLNQGHSCLNLNPLQLHTGDDPVSGMVIFLLESRRMKKK